MDWGIRCVARSNRSQAADWSGGAAAESGFLADRPRDFDLSWSVLWAQFAGAVGARRDAAGPVQTDGSRRSTGARIFRRHDAAHVDCARHDARSAGAISRRAERGPRSANAPAAVGDYPRIQPEGSHDFAHHAQHGRGRRALPAACDYRSRQDHRAGNAGGVEGLDSRRIFAAAAIWALLGGAT